MCCFQPIAVLLCPGWEKVQVVFDLLEDLKVSQTLHPVIVQLGTGKDEAKAVKIPKNCEGNSVMFASLQSSVSELSGLIPLLFLYNNPPIVPTISSTPQACC